MKGIVIFSGTTEGRLLSHTLAAEGAAVTVCVATDYGREEQGRMPGICVRTGRMEEEEMAVLVKDSLLCVDATHPYAAAVSRNIQRACTKTGTPCLRLLRAESPLPEDCLRAASAEAAARLLSGIQGNILVATGAKEIGKYAPLGPDRLYPRVLPSEESIRACLDAGIPRANIIAIQGPFTRELNAALIRQFRIACLVTKDGGGAGGFPEKMAAARDTGARVLVITRPQDRGQSYDAVLAQCREMIKCR
ncbi:MAG: precorrin-6A reductase [Eubacteriales bacterium]|nr:precorrin-6A reductase [Eubacteriales bacterium]